MPTALSESQTTILRSIFSAAPDTAVASLESALAGERGGPMGQVHAMVAQEALNRRARSIVFMPLLPLTRGLDGPFPGFPSQTLGRLWTAVSAVDPAGARAVEGLGSCDNDEDRAAAADLCDRLCRTAALNLRSDNPLFASIRDLLEQTAGGLTEFASLLDLTPLARQALSRLHDWVGRHSEERSAAIRLAYKDAVDLADDAGPRLLSVLCAHLPQPWRILHLISAVMDRPSDRFAAASEVARFGEYFMDDIDRRLACFRAFDPAGGRESGFAAAETLHVAAQQIAEFETSLELSRDGVWGSRVTRQKQSLAQLAEQRLAQIDKALDMALPLQQVRFGKGLRGFPRLDVDPEPGPLSKAEGLLAFFEQSRASANQAGFGSARSKAGERLDSRFDLYVEDLLDLLRSGETPCPDRVRLYLDATAELTGVARGDKAAALVRRRAAA